LNEARYPSGSGKNYPLPRVVFLVVPDSICNPSDWLNVTLHMKPPYTYILLILFLFAVSAGAQDQSILKDKWHFDQPIKQDTSAGYVQVLKVDNVLYISGAVATEITPQGIARVYQALDRSLKSFGCSFQNVVKENLYTTDIETMKKYNATRKAFYRGDFPAATWVQVSRLFMAEAKLEVELVAHLPK
jgi:2-iminobutanoate/2-iminopropanoate deaminase